MKSLNDNEVIEQFTILHVPLTADIKTLRHARNDILHELYEQLYRSNQLEDSLALDKKITTIQHAYLFIKRNYDDIHMQLDVIKALKEKFNILKLPLDATLDDVRHRRNDLLLALHRQEDKDLNLPSIEEQIRIIQNAYLFIVDHLRMVKI